MKGGSRRFLGSTTSLSPNGSSPSSSNNGSTTDDDTLYSNALLLTFGITAILFLVCLVVMIFRHLLFLWVRRVEQRRQKQALPEFVRSRLCELMPKTTYGGGNDGKLSSATTGCAICLSDEFEAGEEIRVFPECGHGFHAECVDVWLVSHLSCPLCRRMLMWRPTSSSSFNC